MKRLLACAAIAVAAGMASSANADVTITLTNQAFNGGTFVPVFAAGTLSGSLTAVAINVTLNASITSTYADDLTIYLKAPPLATGGLLQVGGFSNLAAAERQSWPNGASATVGTTSIGSVPLTTAIDMSTTTATVWVGNGYLNANDGGTWTGTLTLIGVDLVPTPGAASLLGLGGLVALRRRRSN